MHKLHILQSAIDYILELRGRLESCSSRGGGVGVGVGVGAAASASGDLEAERPWGIRHSEETVGGGGQQRMEGSVEGDGMVVDETGRYETKMNLKNLLL